MNRYEYAPLRFAMFLSDSSSSRFARSVLSHRKESGAYWAQVVEAQDEEDEEEYVPEVDEASDDELEAEYQEGVALVTVAKQRRAEVDRVCSRDVFPLHEKVPRYRDIAHTQCSRPYDTLTCYFHTAIWLGK